MVTSRCFRSVCNTGPTISEVAKVPKSLKFRFATTDGRNQIYVTLKTNKQTDKHITKLSECFPSLSAHFISQYLNLYSRFQSALKLILQLCSYLTFGVFFFFFLITLYLIELIKFISNKTFLQQTINNKINKTNN